MLRQNRIIGFQTKMLGRCHCQHNPLSAAGSNRNKPLCTRQNLITIYQPQSSPGPSSPAMGQSWKMKLVEVKINKFIFFRIIFN